MKYNKIIYDTIIQSVTPISTTNNAKDAPQQQATLAMGQGLSER
jgi:hypothetical protein